MNFVFRSRNALAGSGIAIVETNPVPGLACVVRNEAPGYRLRCSRRQRHGTRRIARRPRKPMTSRLHLPRPRTPEIDVRSFDDDLRLPSDQSNLALGEDLDFVVAAGHGDALVGEDVEFVRMRLQAHRPIGGDGLEAAALGVKAGGLAGDGGYGVRGAELGIVPADGGKGVAGMEGGGGRAGEDQAGGRVGEDDRLGEALHRVAALAGFTRRLGGFLSADRGFVFAGLFGVDAFEVGIERPARLVGVEGLGASGLWPRLRVVGRAPVWP